MFSTSFSKVLGAALISALYIQSAVAFEGDATWYDTGLGACGVVNTNSQFVVALSPSDYDSGAHCGKKLTATYEGASVTVTVEDLCEGCGEGSIDLTPSAFAVLAPTSVGRIHDVVWNFD